MPIDEQNMWSRGSVDYFRDEWTRQLDQPSFIYPRAEPLSQWDAFEYFKAQEMSRLVQTHCPPDGQILEYGCGAAGILIHLSNHGYRCVALDAATEALEIARRNEMAEGQPDRPSELTYVCGDALDLPFESGAFDCAVSNGLLEHFAPDVVPELVSEVIRVIKPGGLFLADISHARFSTRQVAKIPNFTASYLAQIVRDHTFGVRNLWRKMSAPMYENRLGRTEWKEALEAAGLRDVSVRAFRLTPPLSLPVVADRWYGKAMMAVPPLRWATSVHSRHIPLGWVYLASGIK